MKMADHMLAIWDGKSKGTAGEIRLANKMNVPTTIVIMNPKSLDSMLSAMMEQLN